jgi:hypothetical protein
LRRKSRKRGVSAVARPRPCEANAEVDREPEKNVRKAGFSGKAGRRQKNVAFCNPLSTIRSDIVKLFRKIRTGAG